MHFNSCGSLAVYPWGGSISKFVQKVGWSVGNMIQERGRECEGPRMWGKVPDLGSQGAFRGFSA